MAISSAGIGSGLDIESIVSQLVALEKRPISQLQLKAASVEARLSIYSQVKSLTSQLSDAASKLSLDSTWRTKTVSSSNSAAVSATITGVAADTSFQFEVQQLARQQSTASAVRTPLDQPLGAGTLSIQIGRWLNIDTTPTFAEGAAAEIPITVAATDTLTDIASKINGASAGVTATVIKDSSGERLLLRSNETGEEAGFRVRASGAAGLSALSFDLKDAPGVGMAQPTADYQPQLGLNTRATINGIAVSSANNTFGGLVPGLSLTVSQVTTSPVELRVSNDKDSMRKSVNAFVDAYNALNDMLTSSTRYDLETKRAGPLQGDSSAVALMNQFRRLVSAPTGRDALFQRLPDIGIDIRQGGRLVVDQDKLQAALDKPDELRRLFGRASDGDTRVSGIGQTIRAFATQVLGADGVINSRSDALNANIKSNQTEQERVLERASVVEKRLRAKYAALDTKLAGLTALSSYIGQQVTAWNKTNN